MCHHDRSSEKTFQRPFHENVRWSSGKIFGKQRLQYPLSFLLPFVLQSIVWVIYRKPPTTTVCFLCSHIHYHQRLYIGFSFGCAHIFVSPYSLYIYHVFYRAHKFDFHHSLYNIVFFCYAHTYRCHHSLYICFFFFHADILDFHHSRYTPFYFVMLTYPSPTTVFTSVAYASVLAFLTTTTFFIYRAHTLKLPVTGLITI